MVIPKANDGFPQKRHQPWHCKYNKDFIKAVSKEILSRIDIDKIELFFSGGFVDDSLMSII